MLNTLNSVCIANIHVDRIEKVNAGALLQRFQLSYRVLACRARWARCYVNRNMLLAVLRIEYEYLFIVGGMQTIQRGYKNQLYMRWFKI